MNILTKILFFKEYSHEILGLELSFSTKTRLASKSTAWSMFELVFGITEIFEF
jgi:hypothetical protein